MNKHLLRIAGMAIVMLALQTTGFTQKLVPTPGEVSNDDSVPAARRGLDEIIIRHKNDKDTKVIVEIKNGEIFINGKPASEYEDDNLAITKRKVKPMKSGAFLYGDDGDMDMAPYIQRFGGPKMSTKIGRRPLLGVTSDRPANGPAGAKIGEVSPGSGADKGGLKQGDLITKVDELPIDGPESLTEAIGRYKPGEKVIITITRDGKEQKVNVTLGTKETNMNLYNFKTPDGQDFNFDFKQLMPPGAWEFNSGNNAKLGIRAQDTEDGKGAKVLYVDGESTAAKAGIKEGDIITRFDGKEVNGATTLAQAARDGREKRTVHVSLLRDGKALELDVQNPHRLKTADL